ncbi:hypothetical protein D3C87_1118880 [compost metagenome]
MNHLLGELDNPHRLPHVQYEDITALPHGTCLNNQLRGFGNCHEVSSDLWVGDRQWPPRLDLFVK